MSRRRSARVMGIPIFWIAGGIVAWELFRALPPESRALILDAGLRLLQGAIGAPAPAPEPRDVERMGL